VASLKAAHVIAELIDFADDVVAITNGGRRSIVCE
jgi:hypothetical protein